MFPRLDDNSQEAFQFLALGAGIMLVLRLFWWFVDRQLGGTGDGADAALEACRNGYLVDRNTLIVGGNLLSGRLALAALMALAGGSVLAVLAGLLARSLHRDPVRGAVHGARWGLLLVGAWALYAVLFLPPTSTEITENGVLLRQRPALFREIALPLPASERHIPWTDVQGLEARSVKVPNHGCGTHEDLVLHEGGHQVVIARIVPVGSDCLTTTAQASAHIQQVAAQLGGR